MEYSAEENRYEKFEYKRCGRSGLKLPPISLGLWHNFGSGDDYQKSREIVLTAFDNGITHFDLANNYGPPPGSAEETFGKILKNDLKPYRDELVISTKAGYLMWPGPYGEWGSRKYMLASLNQSLKRLGLDYVDIYYSHRPDTKTPFEETLGALDTAVRSGKSVYAGISSYNGEMTRQAATLMKKLGTPCIIHQPKYNMFYRWIEEELIDVFKQQGMGCIVFSPLAQGVLTNKYLNGIPADSRAGKETGYLQQEHIKHEMLEKVRKLSVIAENRGQSMAQMAIAWVLRLPQVTSALVGASRKEQVLDILKCLDNLEFSDEELKEIDAILAKV